VWKPRDRISSWVRPTVSPTNVVLWPAVASTDSEHADAMLTTGSRWV
jgi:hypothetical protein